MALLVYRLWLVALLLPQLLQAEKPADNTCDWEKGEVRLVTPNNFVSICEEGVVTLICDRSWTKEDAKVVCRVLGLPTSGAVNTTFDQQGNDYGRYSEFPECAGTETNLTECNWSIDQSDCDITVGVSCTASTTSLAPVPAPTSSSNPTTSQFAPQTTSSYSSSVSALSPSPSAPPTTTSTTDASDSVLKNYYFGLIAAGCVLFLFIFLTLIIMVALLVVCRRRHRKNRTVTIELEKHIPNPLFGEPLYSDPLDSVSVKLSSPVTGDPPAPGPLYHTLDPKKPVADTEGIYSEVQDIIRTNTLPASMMSRPLPPPLTGRSSSTLPPYVHKRGPEAMAASATAISEAAAPYELPANSSRGRSSSDVSRQSEQRDLYASLDESRQYATLEPYMGQPQTPPASEAPRVPCPGEEGTYARLNHHQATPPSTPGSRNSSSDATSTNSEGEHSKLMGRDPQHLNSTRETKEELGSWW